MAVQFEENAGNRQSNALVAILEGVVLRKREGVLSGQLKEVRRSVGEVVLRTRQGRIEPSLREDARGPPCSDSSHS